MSLGRKWPEHVKAPPKPAPCSSCGYPRYESEEGPCPGCGATDEPGKPISSNVRVLPTKPKEQERLTPALALRKGAEDIVTSALAYRATKDPQMRSSMYAELRRINDAVQALVAEVEGQVE